MSLLQLNEKISEHLKAIDDLAEVKPMPKIIQLHFKEIKAYFEQYVETSEKCRRRCDELREIKERQKRTITDLTEDEESLGASMEDKCANDVQMPLLELNEKISEHLDAIDVFSAKNPIPKFIQLHFKEIKEFFEQCVEFSKNMGLPTHFNSSTEVGKVGEENLAGDSPASEAPAEEEIDMELEKEFPKEHLYERVDADQSQDSSCSSSTQPENDCEGSLPVEPSSKEEILAELEEKCAEEFESEGFPVTSERTAELDCAEEYPNQVGWTEENHITPELTKSQEEWASELAAKDQIIAELVKQHQKHSKMILRANDEKRRLKLDRKRDQETIKELEKSMKNLTSEVASKKNTIAGLQEECEKHYKDTKELRSRCEEYRQHCDRLSEAKERHEQIKEEQKKTIHNLVLQLESVQRQNMGRMAMAGPPMGGGPYWSPRGWLGPVPLRHMPPYPGPPFMDGYPLGGPPQMGGEQNMGGPRPNAPFLMADPRETERTVEELTRAKERLTAELDSKERTIAELLEKCARMQVNEAELHVHNIHPDVTQAQILEKFSSIGQVSSTEISRDLSTPSSTASATVSFKHAEDAERAIDTLYGERMKGEPIRIFWSPDSERGRLNNLRRVFVMNLERDIDDDALRHHFEGFGPIVVARVVRSQDERCVGFGFVRFEGVGDADKAVAEMNKTVLLSKTIAVYRHK